MEKRRPHYRLSEIQNVVLLRGLDAFTKTAIDNSDAMGLSDTQMIQAVLNMNKNCLYKSRLRMLPAKFGRRCITRSRSRAWPT